MARLIVHLGHSQCKGRAPNATLDAAYTGEFANIQIWNGSSVEALDQSTNNNQYPDVSFDGGTEYAMGKLLQENWGGTLYYYKYGVGGSKVAADGAVQDWSTSNKSERYEEAMLEMNLMMDYLWNTVGLKEVYHVYLIINHGENDGAVEADADAFDTNMINLITGVLNNLSGTSVLVKTIMIIENNTDQGATYRTTVLGKYPTIVAAFPDENIASYSTDGIPMFDGTHYTNAGYETLGTTLANYIITNNL
jgi:hypothetical protein